MNLTYFTLLIIYLAANAIRFAYEMLKKARKINPESKALFIFILAVMCILWISWFAMCPRDPLNLALPNIIQWAGLGIFAAGSALAFGALFQLKGVENIDHLVTTGMFSKLRHPMYLGFIFWILGWGIFNQAGISLIAGIAGIGNIAFWRHLEENHLLENYGNAYLTYRHRTWF